MSISPLFGAMLWLALFARALDLGFTFLVLDAGGRERNRVVRWCLARLGRIGTSLLQAALVVAFAFSLRLLVGETWASAGLGLLALQGFVLATHNEHNLRRLQSKR
jgi:hypothetical protein